MNYFDIIRIVKNIFLRPVIITLTILLIPFIAMQLSDEMDWDETDFIVIGMLIFTAGLLYELVTKKVKDGRSRLIIGSVIAIAVLYLWAELAVGILTNWGS